eukprot:3122252-Amphidinium_carterae.1
MCQIEECKHDLTLCCILSWFCKYPWVTVKDWRVHLCCIDAHLIGSAALSVTSRVVGSEQVAVASAPSQKEDLRREGVIFWPWQGIAVLGLVTEDGRVLVGGPCAVN